MTFREFTGKNVEEAIRAAMKEFAADLGDLDIEILAQGNRGILGVGGEEARILAAPKSSVAAAETVRVADAAPRDDEPVFDEAPADEAPADEADADDEPAEMAPSDEPAFEPAAAETMTIDESDADDQVEELARADRGRRRGGRGRGTRGGRGRGSNGTGRVALEIREPGGDRPAREPAPFVPGKPLDELSDTERSVVEEAKGVVEELMRLMGIPATVEVVLGGETARLNVRGEGELGMLIGRRGEKLASLQHIVNLIVARREGQHNRIAIDVEGYRSRREDQLRDVAERAAKRVVQSGKIIQLEAMPAIERRIVHLALVDNPKVRTQSVGVEPNRRIVVLPASQLKR